jgi:hypothetical protein
VRRGGRRVGNRIVLTQVKRRSPPTGIGFRNAGCRYPPSARGTAAGDPDIGRPRRRRHSLPEVPPSLCLGTGRPFSAAHLSSLWPGLSSGACPAVRIFRSGAEHPRPRPFLRTLILRTSPAQSLLLSGVFHLLGETGLARLSSDLPLDRVRGLLIGPLLVGVFQHRDQHAPSPSIRLQQGRAVGPGGGMLG